MADELRYAARYSAELTAGFAVGYTLASENDGSNVLYEDLREDYPLNTDAEYDIFTLFAEYSSKKDESFKVATGLLVSYALIEGLDQSPGGFTQQDFFAPEDVAITATGYYIGATAKHADWDDIRKALS